MCNMPYNESERSMIKQSYTFTKFDIRTVPLLNLTLESFTHPSQKPF